VIDRRAFLLAGAGVLAAPSIGAAEPPSKRYRIGILEARPAGANAANLAAFRQGLEELGYVEQRNFVIEYRSVDGQPDRFPVVVAELVRIPVDLILAAGTVAILAAKRATQTIPIVMTSSGDPIGAGAVGSLPYPGGNVTGVSALVAEISGKRIQLLKEAVPAAQRIAVLLDMGNPAVVTQWTVTKAATASMKLVPYLLDVRRAEDLGGAFERATRERADAMMVGRGAVSLNNARQIADLALRHQLPTMFASRDFVEVGGLMAYGVNYAELYRRSAKFVDKIFKGAKPGELPVEEPTNFELVVNAGTANKLRITIPPLLLSRADHVIE
jgi:putative tryptophan/tyrosine transport system substrate-binding protein